MRVHACLSRTPFQSLSRVKNEKQEQACQELREELGEEDPLLEEPFSL